MSTDLNRLAADVSAARVECERLAAQLDAARARWDAADEALRVAVEEVVGSGVPPSSDQDPASGKARSALAEQSVPVACEIGQGCSGTVHEARCSCGHVSRSCDAHGGAEFSRKSVEMHEERHARKRRGERVDSAPVPASTAPSSTYGECDKSAYGGCAGTVYVNYCPREGCARVSRRCEAHGGERAAMRSTLVHAGAMHKGAALGPTPGPAPAPASIPASMLREPARPAPAAPAAPESRPAPAADLLVPAARPAPGRPLPRSSGRSSSSSGGSR